ncbi:hypothetical protein HDF26_001076 [Pedobacter cryoconitis]|uniref:phosphotransferase n=1 Tax=Pedobacter cryoconitis TaxID=188932 RepID=UPI00161520EF|nr:phosphotransferase [Pedobacter cryoconitis]MBB6270649.1 hypothetical protein [Pedobacter cryoconitis]
MAALQNLIPAAKLPAVESALLQTFNTSQVQKITLLAGGLSASIVYKIEVDGQEYVLKLDSPGESADQESCMEIAAVAGIAPKFYYLNRVAGIAITAFIQPMSMQAVFKSRELLLSSLGKVVSSIHNLPLFSKENSLIDTVDGLIAQFKTSKMLTGPVIDACFAHYETIRKYYPWDDEDKVSSHNDLNPNNMVFDGEKIWVIDWDAAFQNDRYVDLAILANFYVTDEDGENIFLEAYFGSELNDYNRARFFMMRQICRLVYAMLMFKLAEGSKITGAVHDPDMEKADLKTIKKQLGNGELSLAAYHGQLLFGKALMNETLEQMRSPRFALSFDNLLIIE